LTMVIVRRVTNDAPALAQTSGNVR